MKTEKNWFYTINDRITSFYLILIIWLFCFINHSNAQNGLSCASAIKIMDPIDSIAPIEQQIGQTKWYEVDADSGYLEISIFSLNANNLNNFTKINLWEGVCDSLILVDKDSVFSDSNSVMTVKTGVVTNGSSYFIEVIKSNPTSSLNYIFQIFSPYLTPCNPNFTTGSNCEFVTDGSFENYAHIPNMQNRLNYTCNWKKPNFGTSDYFNSACYYLVPGTSTVGVDVPQNMVGIQNSMPPLVGPFPGEGYAGFFAHIPNQVVTTSQITIPHLHEYVTQHLVKPLINGVTYNVSFYVSLADRSTIAANYIGMYLSKIAPYSQNYDLLTMSAGTSPLLGGTPVVPQVSQRLMTSIGTSFIADKQNWVQITGTIVGNGEEWITIGNFDNMVSSAIYTNDIPVGFNAIPDPYYYLDNVSIEAVSFEINPATASVCPNAQLTLSADPAINVNWGLMPGYNCTLSCNTCSSTTLTAFGNSTAVGTFLFASPAHFMSSCQLSSNPSVITVGTLGLTATASPNTVVPMQTSNINLTYIGNNGVLNYNWSPSASLNNATIQNPIATPLVTTTYTVNVNNGMGCTGTTTVTVDVFQPICDKEIEIDYFSNSGDFASQVFGNIPVIANKNIIINGNLTIDYDIRFESCNIRMGTGASINVKANIEIADKTHIYSCEEMWDGIYIPSDYYSIKIEGNSIIEDAYNAVVSDNGGYYEIDDAIFNRNIISVVVKNNSLPINPGEIRSSLFTSRYIKTYLNPQQNPTILTLLKSINQLPSFPLKSPNESLIANIGILAENNIYIKIGDFLERQSMNYFDNLGCGIYVDKSNCDIYNNKFQNIVSSPNVKTCNNCPRILFTAIYAIGDYPNAGNAIAIGGYPSPDKYKANYFQEVYQSIDISGYDGINVIGNKFTNKLNINKWTDFGTGKFAIYVSEPPGDNSISIYNNDIQNNFDGIVVFRSGAKSNTNSSVSINSNTILTKGANSTCALGIAICDVSKSNTGTLEEIKQNNIINADLGIYSSNVSGLEITDNSVGISYKNSPAKNTFGINLESCEDVTIDGNCDIYCTTPSIHNIASPIVSGIYVYDSKGTYVTSNRIENTTRALTFEMDCSDSPLRETVVESNHFHDSHYGLYLLNNGKIGIQGDPGTSNPLKVTENYWIGSFTHQTYVDCNNSTNENVDSKFYVWDDGLGLASQTVPKNNSSIGSLASYSFGILPTNGFQILPSSTPNDVNNTYYCGVNRMANRDAGTITTDSIDFGNASIALQEKLLDSIGLWGYEQETVWQAKKYVLDKLNNYPSLQSSTDSLHNFYSQNTSDNIGLLSASQKAIKQGFYAVAGNLNNWVSSYSQIENNQKFMNELVLKNELGQPLSSSDTVNLLDIAMQCKIAGGNAVLQARAMYCAITHQFRPFEDNCINFSGARMSTFQNQNKDAIFFELYPNPAVEEFEINYKIPNVERSEFKIFDVTGHEFKSYPIRNSFGKMSIVTSSFPQGVYLCCLYNKNVQLEYKKLVIIK